MRREAMEPELQLWQHLRGNRLAGYGFRRQHPFGPYILDFFCPKAGLAVEVDGSGHLDRVVEDEARSRWLKEHGVRVIRFWNHDVSLRTEHVLEVILEALHEATRDARASAPPSAPSGHLPPLAQGEDSRARSD